MVSNVFSSDLFSFYCALFIVIEPFCLDSCDFFARTNQLRFDVTEVSLSHNGNNGAQNNKANCKISLYRAF